MADIVKKSIFELLKLNDLDQLKDQIIMRGKKKSVCPIQFLTEEQVEDLKKGAGVNDGE